MRVGSVAVGAAVLVACVSCSDDAATVLETTVTTDATMPVVSAPPAETAPGDVAFVTAPPGFGAARLALDPGWDPDPDARSVDLLSTELGCASGRAPDGRAVTTNVIEGDAAISIEVYVERPSGDSTCPTNPSEPLTVPLDRPLGRRSIVDRTTGEILLEAGSDEAAQPRATGSLTVVMTGPVVYEEGAVSVVEASSPDGLALVPRQFQFVGGPTTGPAGERLFETTIAGVDVPATTVRIDAWQLICDVDTPCNGPAEALDELIDTGRFLRAATCSTLIEIPPGGDVTLHATWTIDGCSSIGE